MSQKNWESFCTPIQASAIKKGTFAILRERPCKILNVTVSKTGKHGHAKAHFYGLDVFTDKKIEDICPSTHNMWVPVLTRVEFDLMNIDDENYLSLMSPDDGSEKEDLQLPEGDIGKNIRTMFENDEMVSVTVLTWGAEEAIIDCKKIVD